MASRARLLDLDSIVMTNQLELKLNYGLKQDTKKQVYSVQAFVFVPRVLALTKSSYPPARFYEYRHLHP